MKFKGKYSNSYVSVKCKGGGDTFMKLTVYIPGTDHHSGHVAAKQGSVAFGLVKSKSGSKLTFDFTAEGRDGHSVTPASGTDIENDTGATITINN